MDDLEITILSEVKSERERQIPHYHLCVESKLQISIPTKQKQAHRQREQAYSCQGGEEGGEERSGSLGLADENYSIQTTRPYCTAQGTKFNILQ